MNTPILSILTPAIWSRRSAANALHREITSQCDDNRVEHLVMFDNRARSVGLKRQSCLDIARGEYIAFVDDDDKIRPDYISQILAAIAAPGADLITFDQLAGVNGQWAIINFDIANTDEPFTGIPSTIDAPVFNLLDLPRIKRCAWHVNVWKRALVKDCLFPDHSYGEDREWSLQARARVRTHHHIDAVLHEYHHSAETTAAPMPYAELSNRA